MGGQGGAEKTEHCKSCGLGRGRVGGVNVHAVVVHDGGAGGRHK